MISMTPYLTALVLLLASYSNVMSQSFQLQNQAPYDSVLSGEYRGSIVDAQGMRHQLVVRIIAFYDGTCEASYDVPDQQILGRTFTTASNENGRILLVNENADASFEGTYIQQSNSIEGVWSQQRTNAPVRLTKTVSSVRYQEPGASVPYSTSQITVTNRISGVALNGTIVTPNGKQRWPLVILISDRGTQDRDATDQTGHRPFLVMADYFARKEWATFRMDDRAVSNSEQTQVHADELTSDLVAAIDRVKSERNIDPARIVLLGHGEGGLLAMRAASLRPGVVQAIVLASTPAVRGEVLLPAVVIASERLYGTDEDVVAVAVALVRLWLSTVKDAQPTDDIVARLGSQTDSVLAEHGELLLRYPMALRLTQPNRNAYISEHLLPMLRNYLQIDPMPLIEKVEIPCLSLVAERDAQVPSSVNLPAWQGIDLPSRSEVRLVVGVNHGFQRCDDCTVEEAESSPETLKPEVLDDIIEWLNRLSAK